MLFAQLRTLVLGVGLLACKATHAPAVDAAPAPSATASVARPLGSNDAAADDSTAAAAAQVLKGRPSRACAGSPGEQGKKGFRDGVRITVGRTTRTYAVSVPETYDPTKPYPIVFGFHGDARTGKDVRAALSLEDAAGGAGIFVYPDGLGQTWHNDEPPSKNVDVALYDALLEEMGRAYCLDEARIMLAGFSRGAFFANLLACRRPVRALAANAGGGPSPLPGESARGGKFTCPAPPPAVILLHGSTDGSVPVAAGRGSREAWRRMMGCESTTRPHEPTPCVEHLGCPTRTPLVWCEVPKMAHMVWAKEPATAWRFFESLEP